MKFDTDKYDFIDFGCSNGDSIKFAQINLNGQCGIGIDIDPNKVKSAKENGYDAILGDITKMSDMDKSVKFVTMIHFLEHLEGYVIAEKCIQRAVDFATDFVYIRQPFYDSDSYLFTKGFKNFWADWSGHKFHMTSFDFYTILNRLKLKSKIKGYSIVGLKPTLNSNDDHIHSLDSNIDQFEYNPDNHPEKKNNVVFKDVFKELEVIVMIEDVDLVNSCFPKDTDQRKVIFDTTDKIQLVNRNINASESEQTKVISIRSTIVKHIQNLFKKS
jgi:hypothetical protein